MEPLKYYISKDCPDQERLEKNYGKYWNLIDYEIGDELVEIESEDGLYKTKILSKHIIYADNTKYKPTNGIKVYAVIEDCDTDISTTIFMTRKDADNYFKSLLWEVITECTQDDIDYHMNQEYYYDDNTYTVYVQESILFKEEADG